MPSSPSALPPTASDCAVKVESDLHEEEKTWPPHKPPVRFAASNFLSLWRSTQSHNSPASLHLGTLTIGSIVFAPCRVQSCTSLVRGSPYSSHAAPPTYRIHYSLAEVTGIQVMAGTVTVSFLFTDPGVDDEAISLYECIPCPPACLARWLQDEGTGESGSKVEGVGDAISSSACCSILERVLRVAPEDGPLPVNDIYTTLVSSAARGGCHRRANRLSAAQQRRASHLRDLYCLSDDDHDHDDDDGAVQGRNGDLKMANVSGRRKAVEAKGASPTPDVKVRDTQSAPQLCQQTGTAESKTAEGDAVPLFAWKSVVESCSSSSAGGGGGGAEGTSTPITTTVLIARYSTPLTLHVFFARVFQKVNSCMEKQCRSPSLTTPSHPLWQLRRLTPRGGASVCAPPVLLALFDSYAALRRFHVYMTVRGHVVQLLDGTNSNSGGMGSSSAIQIAPGATATATVTNRICQGRPPLPPRIPVAFGTECKVWLCMLRDDTAEEDANADADSAAQVIEAEIIPLLRAAPPIDALVTFREYEKGSCDDTVKGKVVSAEEVLLRMLPHLRHARLVCSLHDVPTPSLRPGTTATATANTQSAATSVVRVSGAIFGDRKLLVPCSPEQLTLLASVLADEPLPFPSPPPPPTPSSSATHAASGTDATQKRSAQKRPRPVDDALQALTPALLERIALGTFTDAAASALFDAFGDASAAVMGATSSSSPVSPSTANANPTLGAVQQVTESSLLGHGIAPTLLGSVEDVYEKWCVDPARFGEAFPVFQAVYALVADVFQSPALFRSETRQQQQQVEGVEKRLAQPTFSGASTSLPRVALVLPRGNPTHHPSLSTQQFLRTLRLFFTPWTLHEVGPIATTASSATTQPGTASSSPFSANTCLLWHQRGGILLLFCDEPATQLGALQDDADVVIACGKAAAAWVAANAAGPQHHRHPAMTSAESSAVHFAVISELEVVPSAEHGAHLWLPVCLRAPSLADTKSDDAREDALADAPDNVSSVLQWPTTAAHEEDLSRGQSAVLWERLLCTVGADGNPMPFMSTASPISTRPPPHQQPLPNLPSSLNASVISHPSVSSSLPARRLRHVDVLPKTLRQAVVLWRHLGEASEEAALLNGRAGESGAPWYMLRTLVKALALSCATATPIRMSDVVLVRRFDSALQ